MPSVFTKIINREIPAEILFEDELCLAFVDIAPKAPVHFLVIPKREIAAMSDLAEEDESTMGRCMVVAAKVAREQGLAPGYRVVVNCGDDGGQEVPHIHLHVLGGRKLSWPPG